MPDLKVTLIQSPLFWQNAPENRKMFEEKITRLEQPTDLVILPEMFTTGFTMEAAKFAESMDGPTGGWMKSMASKFNVHLIGSLIIEEAGHFFNRLIWTSPTGELAWYDKRHLFRMAGEHEVYTAGKGLLTVQVKGWRVRPFVCYDLRFPVWSRNVKLSYDLAIYIANWPERRRHAWRTLLQTRAAENQAFVAGVNRIGTDGLGIKYSGDSLIADPVGNLIKDLQSEEATVTCTLSYDQLNQFRQKFPSWKDADLFEINGVEEKTIQF